MNTTLFVHGNLVDSSCWDEMIEYFRSNGVSDDALLTIDFDDVGEPHDSMARQLEEYVSNVDERPLNVISHSLGATGVRYWLETCDRYESVETVIYMAGALHGTHACLLESWMPDNITEPCQRLSTRFFADSETILSRLNEGDETAGDVDYYTVRAMFDRYFLMNPKSPTLDGAESNHLAIDTHRGLLTNTDVHRICYNWVQ